MSSLHEQTPPPEPAKEPEAKVEEPKVEEPAAPGTPDKALQKVQQDLATALRKVDELTASITERQAKDLPPTVKQQQDLQAARAKIEKIRAARSADDPLEETLNEARDGILDVDERLEALAKENAELKAEFAKVKPLLVKSEAEALWDAEAKKRKMDVKVLRNEWDEAEAEIRKALDIPEGQQAPEGVTPGYVQKRIESLYEKRLEKLSKPAPAPRPTARHQPPITPGGGSVTAPVTGVSGHVDVDGEASHEQMLKDLYVKD